MLLTAPNGPGVAVIRALKEATHFDARIIGLAYESLEHGIYMHDIVDKTYHIPYPSAGAESLLNRLDYIHETEKLAMLLFLILMLSFFFILQLEKTLLDKGIHTFLPTLISLKNVIK